MIITDISLVSSFSMHLVFSFLVVFLLSGVAAQGKQDNDNRSSIKTTATTTSTISTNTTTTTLIIKTNTTASTASTPFTNTTTRNVNVSTTINDTRSTTRPQANIGSDGHPPSKVGMQIALGVGISIILIIFICGVGGYCWKFYEKGGNLRSFPFIKNLVKKSAKEDDEKLKLLEDQVSEDKSKADQPLIVESQST